MVVETINYGEVWVNKYKRENGKLVKRARDEWVKLPDGIAPALIDKNTYEIIIQNLRDNRAESLRNNKHVDELGLLRGGYIFCAICGRRMPARYGGSGGKNRKVKPPYYRCVRIEGKSLGEHYNHRNTIALGVIQIDVIIPEMLAKSNIMLRSRV